MFPSPARLKRGNGRIHVTAGRAQRKALETGEVPESSVSFLAEISVRSPQKIFIFIIYRICHLDKSVQEVFYLFLRKEALSRRIPERHRLVVVHREIGVIPSVKSF